MSDEGTRDETVNLSLLPDSAIAALTGEDLWGQSNGVAVAVTESVHDAGERIDRYELVKPLGQGAFAEVWLAMEDGDHGFRKRVALKILKRDARDDDTFEALLHEARVCGHLHHGNIVDVYGVGQAGKTTYIAMEYIEGIPLDVILKKIRRSGLRVPLSVVVDLGRQVASALDHAHNAADHDGNSLELVHRDLKPSNIIVSSDGVAKVTDFGLAKTTTSTQETEEGMLRGTPSYVAPEVWMGTREFNPTIDLFALGAILWEMSVGELLFKGELPTIIGAAVNGSVEHDLQMLRLHQPSLAVVVGRLLQRNVEERVQTAREVGDTLAGLASSYPGPGGLQLFMSLAEALVDDDMTLDEAVAHSARSGDEDWQRFAARLGVGAEGAPLVEGLPSLAGNSMRTPGPTLRQYAPRDELGGRGTPPPNFEEVSQEDQGPGTTRTFSASRRAPSEGVSADSGPSQRSKSARTLLVGGGALVVVAGVLFFGRSAPLPVPAPVMEQVTPAEPPLEIGAGKASTEPSVRASSPRPPVAEQVVTKKAADKKAADKKAATEKGAAKKAADRSEGRRLAERPSPPSGDLRLRSAGTSAAASSAPRLERAPAVAKNGCIQFKEAGLTGWVDGRTSYNPGLANPFAVAVGVHRVEQGLTSDDRSRIENVPVTAGKVTEVVCVLGGDCRFTATTRDCP